MKALIVLISASAAALLIVRLASGTFDLPLSARIGMSVMLLFTALGHFLYPDGMTLMMPEFIPFKKEMVYFTAVIEVAAALGLHFVAYRHLTGWLLIAFFLLILPANIKAALENLNFQTASYDGAGLGYLWFRIPLQALFIGWVYLSSIRVH